VTLSENERGLDVGCGSGALTITCAKKNPQGSFVGMDRWGKEYASFSKKLCEDNALAEVVNKLMTGKEAAKLMLRGSCLLVGSK